MPLVSGAQRNRGRPRPSSPSRPQQNRRTTRLPDYEPPSFPLDRTSQRELAELSNNTDTRRYEEQLKQSITLLTDNVRDINDRYVKKKHELDKLKRQKRNQSEDVGEDPEIKQRGHAGEAAVARLRDMVPDLTVECDTAVREVIDLRVELEDGKQAIQDTVRKVEAESASAADEAQENPEDEAKTEDEDTVMRNAKPRIRGPLKILKKEQEKAAADYATRSLEQRYAADNDYIGFKRLWWDAVHSVDGKPLPDASRWFAGNNVDGNDDEDDEEEDLVIAEEHISIYCPLSMVVMEEPYTSSVCKHTFNKPAIVQFLRSQPSHKAQCPQTGCSKEISIKDFYDDQVMLRRIQRAQAEKERRDVDDEDDDGVDVDGDSSMLDPRNVKAERARDRGSQLLASLGVNPDEDDDKFTDE
ncbi:zinc-finger of the MIZ type in Nse subunit-domain-containing protein [Xylaria bambusicola]|uniref:zinc-finger of the MIZ type in Nse subunit-domain-containing protein n=1 Tax=Xylaria bambusicola TaxID=326684 RepID=UPI00200747D6|nr:zinc-finger of the MIZ type in Nse subunit-domain-containing protein [Xylaria bambusicola]KAI0505724.1 zinc-finger of the MIZ type in Nse subunit-domain-containing protein [Xylaria bambusicola]